MFPRQLSWRKNAIVYLPGGYRLSEEAVAPMMTDWRMSRLTLMLYF
jgi:hypothetical protein